jgi:hypothetical protein
MSSELCRRFNSAKQKRNSVNGRLVAPKKKYANFVQRTSAEPASKIIFSQGLIVYHPFFVFLTNCVVLIELRGKEELLLFAFLMAGALFTCSGSFRWLRSHNFISFHHGLIYSYNKIGFCSWIPSSASRFRKNTF